MQDATGRYADAVASFRRAQALQPSLYVPNLFLGIDLLHLNQAQQAIPFLLRAEALNGKDPQAPLSLGRAYKAVGRFAEAENAYRRALQLDGNDSVAWFDLGIAALDEVEADGRHLSGTAAHSPYARALYGQSLEEQSRLPEAVTEFDAVLAADPHFPCARAQLGFLYLAQGNKDEAAKAFAAEASSCSLATLGEAGIRIESSDVAGGVAMLARLWDADEGFLRSHLSQMTDHLAPNQAAALGAYAEQQQRTDPARGNLDAAIEASLNGGTRAADEVTTAVGKAEGNPAEAQADFQAGRYARCAQDLAAGRGETRYKLLAQCAFMTGDYDRAAAVSGAWAQRPGNNLEALYWSVRANEQLADTAFSRYEQLEPNSEKTHLLLGDMYRQRQRIEQAEAEYKTAAALAPADTAPLYGLASACLAESHTEEALRYALAALAKTPDDPELNLLAGEILVTEQDWTRAERYLDRSTNVKPQTLPHLHVLLGEVYEHTGRAQQAIAEFRQGLASDDSGAVYYQMARLYLNAGNRSAAEDAFAHAKILEAQRRARAVIAVKDGSDAAQSDLQ
jgi:predicted Zn-dependent protease